MRDLEIVVSKHVIELAVVALLASTVAALAADAEHGDTTRPIADGTYHCLAGGPRMMLTLGDITISGNGYRFVTPTGETTSGTYAPGPDRYTWSGDISAIRNDQIVDSGRNQDADNSFWFKYKVRPTSLPTTASCS